MRASSRWPRRSVKDSALMLTYVALLRAVNVGGHNKIKMAELRELAASIGLEQASTYLQSGNLVFRSDQDPHGLEGALGDKIEETSGFRAPVLVITRGALTSTIENNPYPQEDDPKHLHAVFLPREPTSEEAEGFSIAMERARAKGSPDGCLAVGRVLYLRTPGGIGRSELAVQLGRAALSKRIYMSGTARNWRTVLELRRMTGAGSAGADASRAEEPA